MNFDLYFYNSSQEYVESISPDLLEELQTVIKSLPKRQTQAEINKDLFWLFGANRWAYDSAPAGIPPTAPEELGLEVLELENIKNKNKRELCLTTTTLDAGWRTDFAKQYGSNLVQIEAQFGKVESMFKDFCGFKISRFEKRLALGVEIVISEPSKYFSHRIGSISGMAYFDIAKKTLPAIGFDCPILLIGIRE